MQDQKTGKQKGKAARGKEFLLITFFLLRAAAAPAFAQTVLLKDVRFSSQPEKFRIVMDVSAPPVYKALLSDNDLSLFLENATPEFDDLNIQTGDNAVPEIEVAARAGSSSSSELKVHLAYAMPYRVFKLVNPDRLVVDIMKYFEEKTVIILEPFLEFGEVRVSNETGLLSYYLMRFAPSQDAHRLVPALPGEVFSREKLSVMVQKNGAAAGINGGFFSKDGTPLGLVAVDGAAYSENLFHRTCLVERKNNLFTMENVEIELFARFEKGQTLKIDGLNRPRKDGDIILYTPVFGASTKTNVWGREFLVVDNVLQKKDAAENNTVIPRNGFVFSLGAKRPEPASFFQAGAQVQVEFNFNPSIDAKHVLCAGPRLVKDGQIFITSKEEQFKPDVANGRAPRTAVGVTKGGEILLVVVDGRNAQKSKGITLQELARLMLRLGAHHALNLDGGGSSTMVLDDLVVNSPSDGTERKIASALLVFKEELNSGKYAGPSFSEIFFKHPQPIPIFSEGN